MGALFNTQRTKMIVQMLSGAFDQGSLAVVKNNPDQIADLQSDMSSWDYCTKHQLTLPNDASGNVRWRKWLNNFDQNGGLQARNAMAAAIQDNNCLAIEFFAVPALQFSVSTLQVPATPAALPNLYTLAVTAYTPTIDQLPG